MYQITPLLLLLLLSTGCASIIGPEPDQQRQVAVDADIAPAPARTTADPLQSPQLRAALADTASDSTADAQAAAPQPGAMQTEPMQADSGDAIQAAASNAPEVAATAATAVTDPHAAVPAIAPQQLWVRIPFKSGQTSVDKKLRQALKRVAGKYLAESPGKMLSVRGYCDGEPIGGYKGNHKSIHHYTSQVALSQARADAIAAILIKAGIAQDHIQVEGFGASHFIAGNDTAEDRDKNRRVDIYLISPQ